jgi:hypothetical protein
MAIDPTTPLPPVPPSQATTVAAEQLKPQPQLDQEASGGVPDGEKMEEEGFQAALEQHRDEAGGEQVPDEAGVEEARTAHDEDEVKKTDPDVEVQMEVQEQEQEPAPQEVQQLPTGPLRAWETCAIPAAAEGEKPVEFMLPSALATLGDLSQILNPTTWNELLTDEERDQLRVLTLEPRLCRSHLTHACMCVCVCVWYYQEFLPANQSARQQETTVQRLLRGDNFNFSSPVKTFFSDLKST